MVHPLRACPMPNQLNAHISEHASILQQLLQFPIAGLTSCVITTPNELPVDEHTRHRATTSDVCQCILQVVYIWAILNLQHTAQCRNNSQSMRLRAHAWCAWATIMHGDHVKVATKQWDNTDGEGPVAAMWFRPMRPGMHTSSTKI